MQFFLIFHINHIYNQYNIDVPKYKYKRIYKKSQKKVFLFRFTCFSFNGIRIYRAVGETIS